MHQTFDSMIVADIGGTNARFALITAFDEITSKFEISHFKTYPSVSYASLELVLKEYCEYVCDYSPKRACLAVAGPINGDTVRVTNLGWNFKVSDLKSLFSFEQVEIINDFAAFAYAAPYLSVQDNLIIKTGDISDTTRNTANIAVIGPGTGFGAAALVRNNMQQAVLSCEAGHISLAGVTELDFALLKILKQNHSHVSVETIFSGAGLTRLYQAMATVEQAVSHDYDAADITKLALSGQCNICEATLKQFCNWLGSVAGDLAMTFGAQGGVFIGGGILPRMQEILLKSEFNLRFINKGIMSQYVKPIPVTLVVQDNIPLIGAAACLHNTTNGNI